MPTGDKSSRRGHDGELLLPQKGSLCNDEPLDHEGFSSDGVKFDIYHQIITKKSKKIYVISIPEDASKNVQVHELRSFEND